MDLKSLTHPEVFKCDQINLQERRSICGYRMLYKKTWKMQPTKTFVFLTLWDSDQKTQVLRKLGCGPQTTQSLKRLLSPLHYILLGEMETSWEQLDGKVETVVLVRVGRRGPHMECCWWEWWLGWKGGRVSCTLSLRSLGNTLESLWKYTSAQAPPRQSLGWGWTLMGFNLPR